METFINQHKDQISGVLSCYDRLLLQGNLHTICWPEGMSNYLTAKHIRIFDYPKYTNTIREQLKHDVEELAREHHVQIEFIPNKNTRKEGIVKEVLKKRGNEEPGLVHIISAMETCSAYKPCYDDKNKKSFLKPTTAKCLHYYFYFIDEKLGLCFLRIPTWAPFRAQFYCNGHNWLANKLDKKGIEYTLVDNAFTHINDFKKAQHMSDQLDAKELHKTVDRYVKLFCKTLAIFDNYHWSINQAEYATDIIFKNKEELKPLYERLVGIAVLSVKPDHLATFLGKKLTGNYQDEAGNRLDTRILGTRLKHSMGKQSIKLYDKYGLILRIETTTTDVSFFKHNREVEKRDGTREVKIAAMKKGIYSLSVLRKCLLAANRRYIEFLSSIDDITDGIKRMKKVTEQVEENNRNYRGFNFFDETDLSLLSLLMAGEFNIRGFSNHDLRQPLGKNSGQMSRLLKNLRVHGLIKKVAKSYRYYVTKIGKHIIAAALKLKEMFLAPELAKNFS